MSTQPATIVCFTSIHGKRKAQLKRIADSLGFDTHDDLDTSVTHLICNQGCRSEKRLAALGAPVEISIVRPEWLIESARAAHPLDPSDYPPSPSAARPHPLSASDESPRGSQSSSIDLYKRDREALPTAVPASKRPHRPVGGASSFNLSDSDSDLDTRPQRGAAAGAGAPAGASGVGASTAGGGARSHASKQSRQDSEAELAQLHAALARAEATQTMVRGEHTFALTGGDDAASLPTSLSAVGCRTTLPCGHKCNGVVGETKHPACMRGCPPSAGGIRADTLCSLCVTDKVGSGPCVQLGCSHVVHAACLARRLALRWPGKEVSWSFLECSECRATITSDAVPQFAERLRPLEELRQQHAALAAIYLALEYPKGHPSTGPGGQYEGRPEEAAVALLAYYECSKCRKLFCGGLKACQAAADADDDDMDDDAPGEKKDAAGSLLCSGCLSQTVGKGLKTVCTVHGSEGVQWKCFFCCNIATFFCWGTTHFCAVCHKNPGRAVKSSDGSAKCTGKVKNGVRTCPLGLTQHPPTGKPHCLGCAFCKS